MTVRLAEVRAHLSRGAVAAAESALCDLVREAFGLQVDTVAFNRDGYSLNSANGTLQLADGERFFFKFHQEEGEEEAVAEYYRAELLHEAGYPVDLPIHLCRDVGRQIVLYRESRYPRFAEVCRAAERGEWAMEPVIAAQRRLDDLVLARAKATLHTAGRAAYAAEPILQLFAWRLVGRPHATAPGGRLRRFYHGRRLGLAGVDLSFERFQELFWKINGIPYDFKVKDLFAESRRRLGPEAIERYPAVVAHGDAHNANLWYREDRAPPDLVYFDPAFAGAHVPALLAEIKPTFHNVFAHPDWLYHPAEAEPRVSVAVAGDRLVVEHDWTLTPLRAAFLRSKAERFWRPWLAHLRDQGLLPPDWRRILRCALFCCPTLVIDLSPGQGGQTAKTATLGWAIAVMLGAEPAEGSDVASRFIESIAPRP